MMEKIVLMRTTLTCRDIIDIVQVVGQGFNHPSKDTMCAYIRDHSKSYIVEEIESLNIKDILSLLELYK